MGGQIPMSNTKQITVRLPAHVYAAAAAAAQADRRKLASWCAIKIEEASGAGHILSASSGKGDRDAAISGQPDSQRVDSQRVDSQRADPQRADPSDAERRFPKPKATGSNPVGVIGRTADR